MENGTERAESTRLDDSSDEPTKERILRVAEDLFARKGFKGTTTRDIADGANVNVAMVHYHWGSKEELWNAVQSDLLEQGFSFVQKLFDDFPWADSPSDVESFVTRLFNYLADQTNVARLGQAPGSYQESGTWIREMGELFYNGFRKYIQEHTTLDFDPADNDLAVFCLVGAFTFFFYRPDLLDLYFGENPEELSAYFRERASKALTTIITRFGQME